MPHLRSRAPEGGADSVRRDNALESIDGRCRLHPRDGRALRPRIVVTLLSGNEKRQRQARPRPPSNPGPQSMPEARMTARQPGPAAATTQIDAAGTRGDGTPPDDAVDAFRSAVLDKLTYMVGKDPEHAHEHDWFIATALAVRDRIVDRWMDATRRTYRDGRKRVYYFSLEFLIGRLLFDALGNLGLTATARDGAARPRRRSRPAAQARARRGARQRRPRPARRVLHGEHGDARHPGARLRHPLRPRHLPPGAEGRLADRTARGLAVVGQSVGVRAARGHLHDRLRRHRRRRAERRRSDALRLGSGGDASTRSPTTRRSPAGAGGTSTRCGCGRRGRPTRCRSRTSIAATTSARWPTACGSRRSRACSIRATRRPAGHELRLRQEYFFASASLQDLAAPAQAAARRARVARRPRRDPAERHASGHRDPRADAPADRRARHAVGARVEDHDVGRSTTRTTRCCPRRSRPGRCR